MDTKKLEALAAAVEYGSFTRAAENLGYTQSGLTHMMNSLEKDIGFPVLLRGRQGVRLTPAGERIFPLIRNLLVADEALGREIGRINTNREETVRIAAYSSIAIHWAAGGDPAVPPQPPRRGCGDPDGQHRGCIPLGQ